MTERDERRARLLRFSNALSVDDPAKIGEAMRIELEASQRDREALDKLVDGIRDFVSRHGYESRMNCLLESAGLEGNCEY